MHHATCKADALQESDRHLGKTALVRTEVRVKGQCDIGGHLIAYILGKLRAK